MTSEAKQYYIPTIQERASIQANSDMLKLSGDRVFATYQGEGVTAGLPAVFLRLHYCNLTCGKDSGWKCDTDYTWDIRKPEFWQEPEDWSISRTVSEVENQWQSQFGANEEKRLVVTGGEPLIQQTKIVQLVSLLDGWQIEIETNGTILPVEELGQCQFNCSPKLENSGNLKRRRYKPDVLRRINSFQDSWFKFVVMADKDLDEVEQIIGKCELDNRKILIMPEGRSVSEVLRHAQTVVEKARLNGWNMTMRNQLMWFGDKRRT